MRSGTGATSGLEGQLLGLAAVRRHHVDIEVAVVLRRESDPLAIGGKFGKKLKPGISGDAPRLAS